MASQLQIESGQQMRLTEDEIISIQTWDVETVAQDGNVIQAIAQATSWQQGYVWHYNMPIPVAQVTGPQHEWFAALVNALEYTGFQACSNMPMEIQHHLGQILEGQHPLQQGVQIPYWGSKTPERLRGNIAVLEYINSNTNFGRFVEEFNSYHGGTMEEDQQMEGWTTSNDGWDWHQKQQSGVKLQHPWVQHPKSTEMSATGKPTTESFDR